MIQNCPILQLVVKYSDTCLSWIGNSMAWKTINERNIFFEIVGNRFVT